MSKNHQLITENKLINGIYRDQKKTSRERGHPQPTYTLQELTNWVNLQNNFKKLYSEWVGSNYLTNIRPSIDRLNDYDGYSLSNIRLTTWDENRKKSHKDCVMGIGTTGKKCKAVSQYTRDNVFISNFHSLAEAGRKTGVAFQGISGACRGVIPHAGGFIWRYTKV